MKKYKLPHRLSSDPSHLLPNFPFLCFFVSFSLCSILPLLSIHWGQACASLYCFCWFSDAWVELSPPQRLPLGVPIKIAIMEKQKARGGTMGRGKRREPLFLTSLFSFPFPSCPARFLFLPSLPTTQRAEKRVGGQELVRRGR